MKCRYCLFHVVYQDMGASWDACRLEKDLSKAIKACESSSSCSHLLTLDEAKIYIMARSEYETQ